MSALACFLSSVGPSQMKKNPFKYFIWKTIRVAYCVWTGLTLLLFSAICPFKFFTIPKNIAAI